MKKKETKRTENKNKKNNKKWIKQIKKKKRKSKNNFRIEKKKKGCVVFVGLVRKQFSRPYYIALIIKKSLYNNFNRKKKKSKCSFVFRASSPSTLAFGNCLGYRWTSRGRARVVNAHKGGLPKEETIVSFKQFSTDPQKLSRD